MKNKLSFKKGGFLKKPLFFVLFVSFLFCAQFLCCSSVKAQSTLEEAALTTAVAGATAQATKKGDSNKQNPESENSSVSGVISSTAQEAYGQEANLLAKGSSLLGQAGGATKSDESNLSSNDSSVVEAPIVIKAPVVAKEPEAEKSNNSAIVAKVDAAGTCPQIKVYLNDGKAVQGCSVERNKDFTKIEVAGVQVTYFTDEINRVEEI